MPKLPFQYDDGGRALAGFKGKTGDCVARALAIATGLSYLTVYNTLSLGNSKQRRSRGGKKKARTAARGINTRRKWFVDYMKALGFTWVPTMAVGTGCTVHLDSDELPAVGTLVVAVSRHYTTVVDGVIRDTYDPQERGVTVYPSNTPESELPRGATPIKGGSGWAYRPRRCVYGYWVRGT